MKGLHCLRELHGIVAFLVQLKNVSVHRVSVALEVSYIVDVS